MKPVNFPESNVVFAKDQPQYLQLPAYKQPDGSFKIITCWRLSLKERLQVLFKGNLWISVMTFNSPLQPILPTTDKWVVFDKSKIK